MKVSEKIHPSLLGFDFDGVIADTAEAFIRLACEEYGFCNIRMEDITHFDVEQCLDIDPQIIHTIFLNILEDSVGTGLRPIDGAMDVLGELCEAGPVSLVTARTLAQPVENWLRQYLPPSTLPRISVVAMGSHDGKLHHIRELGLSHFIDDRAETCLQLQEAGITSFVFQQPWNHGRHSLPLVRNWQDIRTLCL